jgi:hypothetical protein
MSYLSANSNLIHLLSYAVVKIGVLQTRILPYRPKVVKPTIPILDTVDSLWYTTTNRVGNVNKVGEKCIKTYY